MKTAVLGAGVGIATAVSTAEQLREIVPVEQDPDRLAALADRRIPIHEPGLPEEYGSQHAAKRIVPSAEIPADGLDLIVICVGTAIDDTGSTDVSQVARALDQAAPAIAAEAACVIRSTLPVGSAARFANGSRAVPERLFVAPEFVRQGSALGDVRRPTRVGVGTFGAYADPDALAPVTAALAQAGTPLLVMRAEEASPVKSASNVFLALRLTFADEVAAPTEVLGVDVGPVLDGIGHDPRIGHTYLRPSYGFGASCLHKGLRSLSSAGLDHGLPMHLAGAISEANADLQRRFAQRIASRGRRARGQTHRTPRPRIHGGHGDVRSYPARRPAARLLAEGATCGRMIRRPVRTPDGSCRTWWSFQPRRRRSGARTPRLSHHGERVRHPGSRLHQQSDHGARPDNLARRVRVAIGGTG